MINKFHMNSWMYLGLLPIYIAIGSLQYYILWKYDSEPDGEDKVIRIFTRISILLPIILILLVFLYIKNIIGLPDMILLMLISIFSLNPIGFLFSGYLNIILIPVAFVLSLKYKQ